jgi:uncharacterized sulfatase
MKRFRPDPRDMLPWHCEVIPVRRLFPWRWRIRPNRWVTQPLPGSPFLQVVLAFFLLLAGRSPLQAAEPTGARLNVLLLVADDLNCELGCYGAPVSTPHLDRLASRGVRFERAYCQFPLCSPSRSSFLSGRLPDVTRVLSNPAPSDRGYSPHLRDSLPEAVTLPQLFKNAGIPSVRIGKLFHAGVPLSIGTSSADDFVSWDFTFNPRGSDRDDLDQVFSLVPGKFGGTLSWLAHPADDSSHTDGKGADLAIQQLRQFKRQDRRFFLAVGFFRPHTPYVAPRKYFKRYPADQIVLPELSEQDHIRKPAPAYASAQKEQDAMTEALRREAIQAYRASISFMDAQAGRILKTLESLGLDRNTVVVFTSDHGYHLGDHGLWQKRSLFERSARVPLIIAAPGTGPRGSVAPGVVELLDLYPTLADLCGLTPPGDLDGVSLRPVLENPGTRVRESAFTQVDRRGFQGRSIRTERWRYTEWDEGRKGVELYDYETDPAETRNLAAEQPEQVRILAPMLSRRRSAGIPPSEPSRP